MKTTSIALLEKAVSAAEAVLLDAQNKHDAKPTKTTATKLNKAKDALDLAQKALAAAAPAEVPALPKELATKLKAAVLASDRAGKALKEVLASIVALAKEKGWTRRQAGTLVAATLRVETVGQHSKELANAWQYAAKELANAWQYAAKELPAPTRQANKAGSTGSGKAAPSEPTKAAKQAQPYKEQDAKLAGLPSRDAVAAFLVRQNVKDCATMVAEAFSGKGLAELIEALTEIAMDRGVPVDEAA
ncbi:hypothetical protein [Pseudomonas aeruginosa]|uniref:hypothetical protein n=1 Tax=Pseudomonas aeruginosa TaxID=287 RepID=UPI002454FE83|nr:hypothetical protein [Pseudomonas aeruginosa]MDH4704173.1 hypothetical protein [Pseudomonas aeruginosa]